MGVRPLSSVKDRSLRAVSIRTVLAPRNNYRYVVATAVIIISAERHISVRSLPTGNKSARYLLRMRNGSLAARINVQQQRAPRCDFLLSHQIYTR